MTDYKQIAKANDVYEFTGKAEDIKKFPKQCQVILNIMNEAPEKKITRADLLLSMEAKRAEKDEKGEPVLNTTQDITRILSYYKTRIEKDNVVKVHVAPKEKSVTKTVDKKTGKTVAEEGLSEATKAKKAKAAN